MPTGQILKEGQGNAPKPAWTARDTTFKGGVKTGTQNVRDQYSSLYDPNTSTDFTTRIAQPRQYDRQEYDSAYITRFSPQMATGKSTAERVDAVAAGKANAIVPVVSQGKMMPPVQPKWLNPYKGTPVDDSYSDTLRSMQPETTMPPSETPPVTVTAPVVVPPPTAYTPPAWYDTYKRRGFGSSYGGNWGNGGGYSSGYSPYYSDQMGLYNWQFGG